MPRPKKCRWVKQEPGATFFKPQGIPLRHLGQVVITVDELEALRLADHLHLNHEEVARQMKVSRPTATRMLARAPRAVADALVHGKAIRIEGGDYRLETLGLCCPKCGFPGEASKKGDGSEVCSDCDDQAGGPHIP